MDELGTVFLRESVKLAGAMSMQNQIQLALAVFFKSGQTHPLRVGWTGLTLVVRYQLQLATSLSLYIKYRGDT